MWPSKSDKLLGGEDIFVAKYDASGNVLWARRAGGNDPGGDTDSGSAIVLNGAGDSFITGLFIGTADFGSTVLTSAGGSDIFIAKLGSVDSDSDGVPDDDDLCPGTITGDPVDAVGCSDRQVDGDGDGVCNPGAPSAGPSACTGSDHCPETVIPESVPTVRVGTNRWALVDGDLDFDTTSPTGKGPQRSYTATDTGGCSCEQIIEAQGLGVGHTKFGCSISAMDDWVNSVNQ